MNISYWSRVRQQRWLAKQIHSGTYKPTPISAKARKAATELERQRRQPIPPPPPTPPKGPSIDYWGDTRWELIQRVQRAKRIEFTDNRGYLGPTGSSDRNVERNPVTGQMVPLSDLRYAANPDNLRRIYESGAIREDRWAFLWYH